MQKVYSGQVGPFQTVYRVIVPHMYGARSVKWLKSIEISDTESPSVWNSGVSYKMQNTSISAYGVNIQSIVTSFDNNTIEGYVFGSKEIILCEYSLDNGKTYKMVDQLQKKKDFSWQKYKIELNNEVKEDIIIRAYDSNMNTQPLLARITDRGLFNNSSIHRDVTQMK